MGRACSLPSVSLTAQVHSTVYGHYVLIERCLSSFLWLLVQSARGTTDHGDTFLNILITNLGVDMDQSASITALTWGANRLDVFGFGADNSMYHKAWDGARWRPSTTDWENLGGMFNKPNLDLTAETLA